MKKSSLTLLLLCAGLFLQSQTLLNGAVTEQHSGKAIAGVEIRAFDGGVDRSDRKGRFQISFTDKKEGEPSSLIVDDPGGMLVVNQKELNRFILPSDPKEMIQIVMADPLHFEESRQRYYEITMPFVQRAAKEKRDSLYAQLKRTRDEELTSFLQEKISELRTDSAGLAESVEELADYLARIDLNQASELQQQALALIGEEKVEAALAVLDNEDLEEHYNAAKSRLQNARKGIMDVIGGYELKGKLFEGQFKYLEAAACWERIVEIKEAEMPEDIEGLAKSLNTSGVYYSIGGNYEKNRSSIMRANQLLEKRGWKNDTSLANSYNNLGVYFADIGDYSQAEFYALKGIAIQESSLDSLHPSLATSYINLGELYRLNGKYELAEKFGLKAKLVREMILDSLHPDLALSYNILGNLYMNTGDHEKAEYFLLKSLSVREMLKESLPLHLAASYANLGPLYIRLGQYSNSVQYTLKAVSIFEAVLDSLHPSLATSYNNLGSVYQYMGQYNQAESYLLKSKSIKETLLDSLHPSLATSYSNLGSLYMAISQYEDAEYYILKALLIDEVALDSLHPYLALDYKSLGKLYIYKGDWDNGLKFIKKAAYIDEKSSRHMHVSLGIDYDLFSLAYIGKGELPSALTYLHKADTVFQFESNSKHPRRIPHEQTWARYYALTAQPDSALQKLRLAIELGFKDAAWLEKEEDLVSLRELPEFQAMVKELRMKNE